jgi:hypothetical protein
MDKAPIDIRKLIGVKLLLRDLGPEVVPSLRDNSEKMKNA